MIQGAVRKLVRVIMGSIPQYDSSSSSISIIYRNVLGEKVHVSFVKIVNKLYM